jgi:hypothetical protein
MQALVVLAVLLVAGLLWLLRGGSGSDAPARIVTVAAALLPEHRRDWGRAMAAELAQIHGRGRGWRFAAGAVRVALLPPPWRRNRVLAVALARLAAAAGATVAAASEVRGLSVFAAALAASAGASAVTHNRAAGARAGLLAVVLGAPLHFSVALTAILHVRHYTLTTPYDLAAYPHSGYPDVASYLLSDALGGNIIGLVLYPIPLPLLGAAAGTGLRRLATGRTAPPAA